MFCLLLSMKARDMLDIIRILPTTFGIVSLLLYHPLFFPRLSELEHELLVGLQRHANFSNWAD
jgi:hypothetical protein